MCVRFWAMTAKVMTHKKSSNNTRGFFVELDRFDTLGGPEAEGTHVEAQIVNEIQREQRGDLGNFPQYRTLWVLDAESRVGRYASPDNG